MLVLDLDSVIMMMTSEMYGVCVCVCGALILIYYSKDTCTKTVPINLNMYFFLKLFLNIFYIKRCSYKYKASL